MAFDWDKYNNTKESSGDRPAPGGYVMKIVKAENHSDKEYFELLLDYAEGEYKGYGEDLEQRQGWKSGYVRWAVFYTEKAMGRLKKIDRLLTEGNKGRFSLRAAFENANNFVGRGIGVVLREYQHTYNGKEYNTLEVGEIYLPNEIREGKFKALDKRVEKKTADPNTAAFQQTASAQPFVNNEELPF